MSDAIAEAAWGDVSVTLRVGLEWVAELTEKLQSLDARMLIGLPNEIADAADAVQTCLADAKPAFDQISAAIDDLGVGNLQNAARHWREAAREDEAGLADALRLALKRFANRSMAASKRAQHLTRGLNVALRSLHALGAQESGRLIAEA